MRLESRRRPAPHATRRGDGAATRATLEQRKLTLPHAARRAKGAARTQLVRAVVTAGQRVIAARLSGLAARLERFTQHRALGGACFRRRHRRRRGHCLGTTRALPEQQAAAVGRKALAVLKRRCDGVALTRAVDGRPSGTGDILVRGRDACREVGCAARGSLGQSLRKALGGVLVMIVVGSVGCEAAEDTVSGHRRVAHHAAARRAAQSMVRGAAAARGGRCLQRHALLHGGGTCVDQGLLAHRGSRNALGTEQLGNLDALRKRNTASRRNGGAMLVRDDERRRGVCLQRLAGALGPGGQQVEPLRGAHALREEALAAARGGLERRAQRARRRRGRQRGLVGLAVDDILHALGT
mmetsp:Transcript_13272/g.41617  ORF Transcript_13272/g.41617 Transcript_13272/m.41617 type:complete len:354 (+) Transcript_13272:1196-2257(+)